MLPLVEGVDTLIAKRTVKKVWETWDWDRTWGWDFPWIAMGAARTGQPDIAVDALLKESSRNAYPESGINKALYVRGWVIHKEVRSRPQYTVLPPDMFEEEVQEWREEHAQWRVADSLWRDSVGRGLIDSATSKRPVRPPRPLPAPPDPVYDGFDRTALKVYGWFWDGR